MPSFDTRHIERRLPSSSKDKWAPIQYNKQIVGCTRCGETQKVRNTVPDAEELPSGGDRQDGDGGKVEQALEQQGLCWTLPASGQEKLYLDQLGSLRGKCQDRIRHTRGLLGRSI